MEIPKKFSIFGLSFTIKQPVKVDKHDSWGEASIANKTIKIKKGLNQEQKEVTYYHEIIHIILDSLEYSELSSDEDFVERFSKALHQVLTTSK